MQYKQYNIQCNVSNKVLMSSFQAIETIVSENFPARIYKLFSRINLNSFEIIYKHFKNHL